MKKLYTLLLAAAVTLTAAAANPLMLGKYQLKEDAFAPKVAKKATVVSEEKSSIKTLANETASFPTDLATEQGLYINYTLDLSEGPEGYANEVTFTKEEEGENGLILYSMTGWLTGIFNENITIHPMPVIYDTTSGRLRIPCNEEAPILTFNGNSYFLWAERAETGYLYDAPLEFNWDGNGFTWKKETTIQVDEAGKTEPFTFADVWVGRLTPDDRVSTLMSLNNLSFKKPTGEWSDICHLNTGDRPLSTLVFTEVNNNVLTIDGFFGYVVDFTIDGNAKTLTAENVTIGQVNVGTEKEPVYQNAYLSEAINDLEGGWAANAYPAGEYKLVMTYEVGNGATNITCPDWNLFVLDQGIDFSTLYPMSDTKIKLNFELAPMTGISNVTVADENAPVEYYNLQGVRVANPESGLYIKRQGNKATKVLVK